MREFLHIFSFEWKLLWRNYTVKALLLVIIGAGIYGIYFGKFEIDKQNERISYVEQYAVDKFDSLLIWAKLDTTIAENKEKFERAVSPTGVGWALHFSYCISNDPGPSAGLCLGQRDLFPVYYRVNMTDLSRQLNSAELANPMKLLTGNFDLSYVFIFLFPLLIISLYYNLYAVEREGGTLALLQSQPIPINKVLLAKGFMRFVIIWVTGVLLLILGFLIQGVSLAENIVLFAQWLLVISLYTMFWVLIMTGIIALKRSSSLSAMLGLGVWLLLTLITPAFINLMVNAKNPLPNRAEAIDALRAMNDKNWESPSSFVLDQFYVENPQYDDGDTTDFYKWYYATFTLLDREANQISDRMDNEVDQRNAIIKKWEWLAPAALVHERLSGLSGTDRNSHKSFINDVHTHHKELKDIYFARIFKGEKFSLEDLEAIAEAYVYQSSETKKL